jgi:AraC-like DNA-binding protein
MFPQPVVPYVRAADVPIRQHWYTPPRRLLDYLLFCVQDGHCLLSVDGVESPLAEGEICFIQPDTLHSLRGLTSTATPFVHLDIFHNPHREEGFPTRGGQVNLATYQHLLQPRLNDLDWIDVPIILAPVHPVQFRSTLVKLVEVWQNADEISRLEANHLATELVLAIFKQYGRVQTPTLRQRHSLNWIPAYLSFHVGEPLSVADMARRAHLSPSRFTAVFRHRFGFSPHQYLLRLRVEYAQSLLKTTDLPLPEIAAACGFSDVHHFSKAFKRIAELSPGAFRRG